MKNVHFKVHNFSEEKTKSLFIIYSVKSIILIKTRITQSVRGEVLSVYTAVISNISFSTFFKRSTYSTICYILKKRLEFPSILMFRI